MAARSPTGVKNAMRLSLTAHGLVPGTANFNTRHNAAARYNNSEWPLPAGVAPAAAALTAAQTDLIGAVTTFVSAGGQTDANANAVAAALATLGAAAGAGEPPKVAAARAIAVDIAAWMNADAAGKAAPLALIAAAEAAFTALAGGRRRGRKSRKATKKAKKSKKSKKSKKAKKSRKSKGRK